MSSAIHHDILRNCCHISGVGLLVGNIDDADETDSASDGTSSYYQRLLQNFQGDFDNYNQVIRDRQHGLTSGEGGGHEHIHCVLVPCPTDPTDPIKSHDDDQTNSQSKWVLAAFYFNGNPRQIFRFRMYRLVPSNLQNKQSTGTVRMILHTLSSEVEQQLRQCSDQPEVWWREVWSVWKQLNGNNEHLDAESPLHPDEWNQFLLAGIESMVSILKGCDVLWDPHWSPSKHQYLYNDEYDAAISARQSLNTTNLPSTFALDEAYHATMEAGTKGAIVDSISLIPGKRILIKDELSLWEEEFWINDRGYDPDAIVKEGHTANDDSEGLPFVYGNRRLVPYKLARVSRMSTTCGGGVNLIRSVVNSELEWTLGDEYRTAELYQEKLSAVDVAFGKQG
eukprot:g532.t1 g532   contig10:238251-239432(+)